MKRFQYNNILRRPAYLFFLFLLAASRLVSAQEVEGEQYERGHIWHERTDTIYVYPGEHTRMFVQSNSSAANIHGFSRWLQLGDNKDIDEGWYEKHLLWKKQSDTIAFKYDEKLKCYVAKTQQSAVSQPHYSYVEYVADKDNVGGVTGILDSLAWDASAWNDWEWNGDSTNINQLPTAINLRRKFIIKNAKSRYEQLKKAKEEYEEAAKKLGVNTLVEAGFFEKYTVHTPLRLKKNHGTKEWQTGVNFRLKEVLSNYYLKSSEDIKIDSIHSGAARYVRWRVFNGSKEPMECTTVHKKKQGDSNKEHLVPKQGYVMEHLFATLGATYADYVKGTDLPGKFINNASVFYCVGLEGDATANSSEEDLTRYITAEVSLDENDWYPVALITVYLDPYSDPKTAEELKGANDYNYVKREQDRLDEDVNYDLIAEINFDDPEADGNKVPEKSAENYRLTRLNKGSSDYAFADLRAVDKGQRTPMQRSLSRSEYAFFKTLEVYGLSSYNNYYYKPGGYYVKTYDRLYERQLLSGKTTPDKMGYFLYLDAIDEPGRIVSLPVNTELCSDTKLLVTAWVCNMESTSATDAVAGDIGLTFKGITEEGEEVDLHTFYSGSMRRTPARADNANNPDLMRWQQICYEFSVPNTLSFQSYRLDLFNNCQHSDGADYAVDEIKVYRSTPNIYVRRKATCDLNSVLLRSNYQTLLENMNLKPGDKVWSQLSDEDKKKYALLRLGLEGLDDTSNGEDKDQKSDYFKNLYYSFLRDFHVQPPTRDIYDEVHEWLQMDYNGDGFISQFGRVIISTRIEDIPTNQEEANELSKKLNLRALKEYQERFNDLKDKNILPEDAKEPSQYESDDLSSAYQLFHDLGIAPINCAWFMPENVDEGGFPTEGDANPDKGFIFLADIQTGMKARQAVGESDDKKPDELLPGVEYYVMLLNGNQKDVSDGGSADPHSKCALIAPFHVMDPIRLVINGQAEYDPHGLCMNNPVDVNAALQAVDPDGNVITFAPTYYCFDWYFSPNDPEVEGEGEVPSYIWELFDDLQTFRKELNKDLSPNDRKEGTEEDLRKWQPSSQTLKEIQQRLIEMVDDGQLLLSVHDPEFILDKERLTFYSLPFSVDMDKLLEEIENKTNRAGALLCMNPRQMILEATETAPVVQLGLPDIKYPDDMLQVPLRIGTHYVKECRKSSMEANAGKSLRIPVRHFKLSQAENADHLGFSKGVSDTIRLYSLNGNYVEGEPARAVLTGADIKTSLANNNYIQLQFLPDFKPLEGFIYTLKIELEEQQISGEPTNSCHGIVYLPLKIVPKYLTWVSDGSSRNWNNDGLWRRSNQAELYVDGKLESVDANKTDGPIRTDLEFAFAPMDFSYVTVLKPENSSWLYKLDQKNDDQSLDMKPNIQEIQQIGDATERIEYDMVIKSSPSDNVYSVTHYYGNTCNFIYFKPRATLMRQDLLHYNKAKVEFEMDKNKKYFLSSPLQEVIAGDMYSTGGTGRQESPVFIVSSSTGGEYTIKFDEKSNNRFNPAFYQKIWDNSAKMYLKNGTADETYDAVASNWNVEYNDVSVPYKPGTGFYSSVENFSNDRALVRLPKGDTWYNYYDTEGKTEASDKYSINQGIISLRDKLSFDADTPEQELKATVTNATNGTFFFVGNPFMTYLNMDAFFNGNPGLSRTYWTEYDAFVLKEDGTVVSTDGSTGGFLKTMQGFFVQKNSTQKEGENPSLTVTFTPKMMAADYASTLETRSSEEETFPTLYISTERKGERSAISIVKREGADAAYRVGEDAVVLLDTDEKQHPALYSVAGSQAVAINQTSDISNIPLGIYSDDAEDVTLTFEGIEQFDSPLYLYDALLDESIRLDALNTKVTVPGSTHGRYFLNGGKEGLDAESDIAIYSPVAGEIIVATSASDLLKTIRVYDLAGRLQLSLQSINESVKRLYLTGGVYIVKASTEKGEVKGGKVIVR